LISVKKEIKKEQKAEEEEGKKVKKIASQISKDVKEFWSNIEKVCKFYCLFCNKNADSLTKNSMSDSSYLRSYIVTSFNLELTASMV